MFETLVESGDRRRSPSHAGAMALAVHVVVVAFAVQRSTGMPVETPRLPIEVIFAEDPPSPTPVTASTATVDDPGLPTPPEAPIALPGPVVIGPLTFDSLRPVDPGADLRRSISNDAQRVRLSPVASGGTPGSGIHLAGEVDEPVRVLRAVPPRYPRSLEMAGISGRVLLQFVVDTSGTVEPHTLQVVEATDSAFAQSSREALTTTRFAPARAGGQVVRQLVRQTMLFSVR
jgi:TonB family protein